MGEDWSSKKERCGSGCWELKRHSFSLQGFMVTIQMRFHRSQWELVICKSVWSQELQLHYISVCTFKFLFSYGNINIKYNYNFVRNYIWPSMTSLVPRTFTISIFLLFNWKKVLQSKNWGEHVVLAMFPVYWPHERNVSFHFHTIITK